jgi:hypothetical protein
MLAYIDKTQKDQQQELILFVQIIEKKSKEIEIKLDKLTNAFLDGLIEKDIYLQKKEELINLKQDLRTIRQDWAKRNHFGSNHCGIL